MHPLGWLARPRALLARLRYWRWERRHPDAPWLCPGAVEYCRTALTPAMRALEFGSGRSTLWLARRVAHLTSVEHNEEWHRRVGQEVRDAGISNVDLTLVPLDHPESAPERESYDALPRYVGVLRDFADATLDLVLVDGHYRTQCVRHAPSKIRPGGLLMVDDSQRWPSLAAMGLPRDFEVVSHSSNGLKTTTIWRRRAGDVA